MEKWKTSDHLETVELDELYWFTKRKPHTKTRENIYIMTMVSREPRQIVGHAVSTNKSSRTIQSMVDSAPEAEKYCSAPLYPHAGPEEQVFSQKAGESSGCFERFCSRL